MGKIVKCIKTLLKLSLLIILIVSVFISKRYGNLNWFEKIFKAPFYESTFLLNKLFDFRVAYFLTYIIGYALIYPTFATYTKKLFKAIQTFKKLYKIHVEKVSTDEEQIEKVQKMLDIYEKEGMSLFDFITTLCSCFFGMYYLQAILGGITNADMFASENKNFLWFSLVEKDNLYILPSIYVLFSLVIPIIKYFKVRFSNVSDFKKVNASFNILITIACSLMLLYATIYSASFALFICIIYIISFFKGVVSHVKNIRENKRVTS